MAELPSADESVLRRHAWPMKAPLRFSTPPERFVIAEKQKTGNAVHNTQIQQQPSINDEEQWVGSAGSVTIEKPPECSEITLEVHSGPDGLYDYYPFLVTFSVDQRIEVMTEFNSEWEFQEVRLPVASGQSTVTIEITSELASRPSERELGTDERILSVCVKSWRCEPNVELPKRKRLPNVGRRLISNGPHSPPAPVFIIGCYRSGTSILTWAVGQHPEVYPVDENNWLLSSYFGSALFGEINDQLSNEVTRLAYKLDSKEYVQWHGESISSLLMALSDARERRITLGRLAGKPGDFDSNFRVGRSAGIAKTRWVDGTPENSSIAIGLAEMFPLARFIYLVRSPKSVVNSLMQFQSETKSHGFAEAVEAWESLNMMAYEAAQVLGSEAVTVVEYEDMIRDPRTYLRRIFAHIDCPAFDAAAKTFRNRINSSGVKKIKWTQAQEKELARLEKLKDSILQGQPFESVKWKVPVSRFEDRRRDVVGRISHVVFGVEA